MGCGASSATPPEGAKPEEPAAKASPEPATPAASGEADKSGASPASASAQPAKPAAEGGGSSEGAAKPAEPTPEPAAASSPPPPAPAASTPARETPPEKTSTVLPKHVGADELGQLCQATNFDRKQVERLYEVFKVISSIGRDDGFIDKSEFEQALGLRPSLFVDRIFRIFDKNRDANIAFDEFVHGLSVFSPRASRDEKAAFAYRIYDLDEDGKISREDLRQMVRSTVTERKLDVNDEQLDELVTVTFSQGGAAGSDHLELEAFTSLVKQRPAMIANMTIASLSVSR